MRILTPQNPQDLDSIPALREALAQANEALVQMMRDLSVTSESLVQMMQELLVTSGSLVQTNKVLEQLLNVIARMAAHRFHGNTAAALQVFDELLAQCAEPASNARH